MTTQGTVLSIPDFDIPQLNRRRTIRLYLPPDYSRSTERYPVLYMQDGQNVFLDDTSFVGSWKVAEALDQLHSQGRHGGAIIVGIDNGNGHRWDEYSPWPHSGDVEIGWGEHGKGGEGDRYTEFIVQTLKPFIDRTYRTRPEQPHTGIAGSSMGGLISLAIGLRHSEVFGKIAVFSPAFWFAKGKVMDLIRHSGPLGNTKIYLDAGRREEPAMVTEAYVRDATEAYQLLQTRLAFPDQNLTLVIDDDGIHHETSWRKRFPSAFCWLFSS